MQKILLPIDGSKPSEKAGKYAISDLGLKVAEIIVLYVIDTSYLESLPQKDLYDELKKELKAEGEITLEHFKQKLEDNQCEGKCTNVNFIPLIKEGKPAEVILKTIKEENIDHVIMGKSGKHGIEKLVLGSTTEKVVRYAEVPVSVI
ncbi:universal stress protein [Methanobacterium alcaliphilum]|uniref:universal stress protein n=1 Tax=Methanobacterium alcaliphilum TaxID=392018 RepID=UPI0024A7B32D|nr:universal stress protein [Methanobacterium alcaliphilum]